MTRKKWQKSFLRKSFFVAEIRFEGYVIQKGETEKAILRRTCNELQRKNNPYVNYIRVSELETVILELRLNASKNLISACYVIQELIKSKCYLQKY